MTVPAVPPIASNISAWVRQAAGVINQLGANDVSGLSVFCAGVPDANEIIAGGLAPRALTLSATTSAAHALTGATGTPVFTVKRNGTAIGSITFTGAAGAVAFTDPAVAAGDQITVHAPSSPDATLADIAILLRD